MRCGRRNRREIEYPVRTTTTSELKELWLVHWFQCVCVSIVQSDVEFLIGSNCAAENIRWLDAVCMLHAVFEGTTTSNGILFSQQKRTKNETKQNIIPKHRKHCARILRTNIHSTTQTNKICKFASPYYYMVFALSWIESIGHWIAEYFQKKKKRETNLVVNIRALSRFCAICQIKCGETAFIRLEQCLCVCVWRIKCKKGGVRLPCHAQHKANTSLLIDAFQTSAFIASQPLGRHGIRSYRIIQVATGA